MDDVRLETARQQRFPMVLSRTVTAAALVATVTLTLH
jgi:hypothetical protein